MHNHANAANTRHVKNADKRLCSVADSFMIAILLKLKLKSQKSKVHKNQKAESKKLNIVLYTFSFNDKLYIKVNFDLIILNSRLNFRRGIHCF